MGENAAPVDFGDVSLYCIRIFIDLIFLPTDLTEERGSHVNTQTSGTVSKKGNIVMRV